MTPTTEQLAAVRQEAERIDAWEYGTDNGRGHPYVLDDHMEGDDAGILAKYILATIPPDPQAPITAEWLRECWGFRDDCCWESEDEDVEQSLVDTGCYKCVDPDGVIIWCEETGLTLGRDGHTETIVQFPITTRHQFAKLMTALGIEPKKGGVV